MIMVNSTPVSLERRHTVAVVVTVAKGYDSPRRLTSGILLGLRGGRGAQEWPPWCRGGRQRRSMLEGAARGSGLEDDPAGDAAGGLRAVRLGGLRERVHRADLGAQVPLVDQAGELGQLSAAGFLDEHH